MKLVIIFLSFVLYAVYTNAQLMHGALKDEILNELMSEMEVMKQDILVGLKNEMHEHHPGSARMVSGGDPLVGDVPDDESGNLLTQIFGGGYASRRTFDHHPRQGKLHILAPPLTFFLTRRVLSFLDKPVKNFYSELFALDLNKSMYLLKE